MEGAPFNCRRFGHGAGGISTGDNLLVLLGIYIDVFKRWSGIGPSWTYYSLQIWNPFLSFLSVLITGDEEAASKYALREALRLWWWHHHLPDGPVLAGCELGIDRALALAPIRNLVNFCALVRQ